MSIPVSGNAVFNGINFSSRHIDVQVRRKGSRISTKTRNRFPLGEYSHSNRSLLHVVDSFFASTPFLRGPYGFVKIFKMGWKSAIPLMALGVFFLSLLVVASPSLQEAIITDSLSGISELFLNGMLIVFFLCIFYFSPIAKYHGAEHKAINLLISKQPLTMENMRKSSRISVYCGTIYVVLIFIIYPILAIFMPSLLALVLGISIAYELFRAEEKWLMCLLKPIYALALAAQKYITTREPDDKQLKTALVGITQISYSLILDDILREIDKKNFPVANTLIDELISIEPKNPVFHFYKSYNLIKQNKFSGAQSYMEISGLRNGRISKNMLDWLDKQCNLTS